MKNLICIEPKFKQLKFLTIELTSKDDDGAVAIIAQTSIWEVVLFHFKDQPAAPVLITRSFLPAHWKSFPGH